MDNTNKLEELPKFFLDEEARCPKCEHYNAMIATPLYKDAEGVVQHELDRYRCRHCGFVGVRESITNPEQAKELAAKFMAGEIPVSKLTVLAASTYVREDLQNEVVDLVKSGGILDDIWYCAVCGIIHGGTHTWKGKTADLVATANRSRAEIREELLARPENKVLAALEDAQRGRDLTQIVSYLDQAENAIDQAKRLYEIACPNGLRFWNIDFKEIADYVTQARKAVRQEANAETGSTASLNGVLGGNFSNPIVNKITPDEIKRLILDRNLLLTDVIDVVCELNGFLGVGYITFGEQIGGYIKAKAAKSGASQEAWLNS